MWWQEARRPLGKTCVGNESVPKIVIIDTVNLLLKTAISILVISNHNSFRALFDEIFALEMASTMPVVSTLFVPCFEVFA